MLKQPELAAKAGLHKDRLRAILGESNAKDVQLEELYAIADAAGVPRDFMQHGWPATADERLAALEATVRRRIPRQDALGETVAALAEELAQIRRELRARQTGD